jgi:hypothetical protein
VKEQEEEIKENLQEENDNLDILAVQISENKKQIMQVYKVVSSYSPNKIEPAREMEEEEKIPKLQVTQTPKDSVLSNYEKLSDKILIEGQGIEIVFNLEKYHLNFLLFLDFNKRLRQYILPNPKIRVKQNELPINIKKKRKNRRSESRTMGIILQFHSKHLGANPGAHRTPANSPRIKNRSQINTNKHRRRNEHQHLRHTGLPPQRNLLSLEKHTRGQFLHQIQNHKNPHKNHHKIHHKTLK